MTEMIQLSEKDLFVAYRMPLADDYHVIIADGKSDSNHEFIIHPFDKNGSSPSVSIRSSHIYENQPFSFIAENASTIQATDKASYIQLANSVIQEMKTTDLEKVVLSRIHCIEANDVNIFNLFQKLCTSYPRAFIYLYNIPKEGTWMGATPEILMERKEDIITTVALAATQKVDGRSIAEVSWNDKEVEEQAIIQRYIETHLTKKGHEFQKGKTYTSQAGNVFHIKTVYDIPNMHSTDELVNQLHPGPAICGMPKENAKQRILEGEAHDRAYYCGYLGLKTADHTRLFINLRCMQVFKDQFALYVGGGLTANSTAESEWNETVTKSKTLEAVIQKSYIYAHDNK